MDRPTNEQLLGSWGDRISRRYASRGGGNIGVAGNPWTVGDLIRD